MSHTIGFFYSTKRNPTPYFLLLFYLLFHCATLSAQDCHCTVQQVQNNMVTPCDIVIGDIIEVSSVPELRNAISQANNNGGNMTILIEDGTYPIASTASFPYITGDNVVFKSKSGNRDAVIITGQGMVATSSTEDGFLIAGKGVVIADLTIRDVGNHGIQVSGHELTVHNVKIQNTYEQMLKGSTSADRIESGLVQCCLFEYTAGVGPNWYIGGIDVHKGIEWIVRDNVFKNIASPHTSLAEHAVHFWNGSSNNTIERNMIFNCDRGVGFGLGDNEPQNQGGIIRNNMIYNDGTGLYHDVGIGLESSPGTLVYNNTIFIEYPNAIEYRFASTVDVEVINNLTNKAITSRNGGIAFEMSNHTSAIDNWFVDVSQGNLRLAESQAEVVNQGTSLQFVTDDIDQNPRLANTQVDIGAQELPEITSTSSLNNFKIELAPNPADDHVRLTLDEDLSQAQIFVFDIKGKKIKQLNLNGNEIIIDVKDFGAGIYSILLVDNKNQVEKLNFVISK